MISNTGQAQPQARRLCDRLAYALLALGVIRPRLPLLVREV
jgi:hypothetical protein